MNAAQLQTLKELIELLKQNEIGEFSLEQQDLKVQLKFAGQETASTAGNTDIAQMLRLMAAMPQGAVANPALPPAAPAVAASAQAPATQAASAEVRADAGEEAGLHTVKSPIVGTFYEAPSPGSPAFVKPGDIVESGQVLCIVEAMKLMNEIEADASGEIVKRLVTTGQPVEYGQALFLIRPR